MRKAIWPATLIIILAGFGSCGKKGPISPPLVLVPEKPESFKAFQRGAEIILEWTNPESYIDGRPLGGIAQVEIWMEEKSGVPPKTGEVAVPLEFERRAKRIAILTAPFAEESAKSKPAKRTETPLEYSYELGASGWSGKIYVFAARVRDALKNRLSEFSNEASVEPRALAAPLVDVRAKVFEDRISVEWKPPTANFDGSTPALVKGYNVYRIDKGGVLKRLNATLVSGTAFADRDFIFGEMYRYLVRAAGTEAAPFLESGDSSFVDVTPVDTFPPAVPTGLSAVKGSDFITLVWDPGTEKDLAGYNVWRRDEGKDSFSRLTPSVIPENTFTDKAVEKNKRYEYAISSVDVSGNESARSASLTEMIKDFGR
jgi:hypothetical protein